jgi:hypothetical protein
MRIDEGVVRGLIVPGDQPEDQSADDRQKQYPDNNRDEDRPFFEAFFRARLGF